MKKITLLSVVLICSMSVFSMRYLVQPGTTGGATWRTAGSGETLVDLTSAAQSFNAWYNATVNSSDEVWVVKGTYVLTGAVTVTKTSHSVYGGFSGTENAVSERAMVAGGNPWEFSNPTVLDGNNTVQILTAGAAYSGVVFDGLTFTKGKAASGAGAQFRDGVTLQNCIISNNVATASGGGINLYSGGTVKNCLITNNTAVNGGGIYSNNASATVSPLITGCLIQYNQGTTAGGGMQIQGSGAINGYVKNTIFRGNKALGTDGTTLKPGGGVYSSSIYNNFINCLLVNNTGTNTIYFNGGNFVNSTVANNVGQVYMASASLSCKLTNCIVWGNKTDATGATNTGVTSNTANTAVVITNCGVSPALPTGWTQSNNFTLEFGNDSQANSKGPGFVNPTTFWGAPATSAQTTELEGSNWNIKLTSGALNTGTTNADASTDILGTSRPQGSAYDIGAYEVPYYTVTITFNSNGTVDSYTSGDVISRPKGTVMNYTITPNAGYKATSVLYNTTEVVSELASNVYTAPSLTSNSTLNVTFNIATRVSNPTSTFKYYTSGNQLKLDGVNVGDKITIYNTLGSKVTESQAGATDVTLNVSKGVYLVRVANQTVKVIVK